MYKRKVYIESSVISYLSSKPSRDIVMASRQAITRNWWDNERSLYDVYVSVLVEREIAQGDSEAAEKRLQTIADIENIPITEQAVAISKYLIDCNAVPRGSEEDALHIAIAAANGMDFLLTWNFRHINNAVRRMQIVKAIGRFSIFCPEICSPEQLGGDENVR